MMKKMLLSLVAAVALSGGITCLGAIDVYIVNSNPLSAKITAKSSCNNGRNVSTTFNGTVPKNSQIQTYVDDGCVVQVTGSMSDGTVITPFSYAAPSFANNINLYIQKNGSGYQIVKK